MSQNMTDTERFWLGLEAGRRTPDVYEECLDADGCIDERYFELRMRKRDEARQKLQEGHVNPEQLEE